MRLRSVRKAARISVYLYRDSGDSKKADGLLRAAGRNAKRFFPELLHDIGILYLKDR